MITLKPCKALIPILLASMAAAREAQAQATAVNVRAIQRTGTKLVDIDYAINGITSPLSVALKVSIDGGSTWAVPVTSTSGDIGNSVIPGPNLRITWNAGLDWNQQNSSQTRFQLTVYEGLISPPTGFAAVMAGNLPDASQLGAQGVDDFYLAKHEVQWSEWQAVREWALLHGYQIGSVGVGRGPTHPVTDVKWHNAVKWCNARSEKEGFAPVYTVGGAVYRTGELLPSPDTGARGYRLPSEKEWEFAARGGIKTHGYEYSGSSEVGTVAWYSSNSASGTQEVGTKAGNELGIFDMSGNVWEWCFEEYSGTWMHRGGCWSDSANYCRVFNRLENPTAAENGRIGFRVARSSVPSITATSANVTIDTRDPIAWTLFTAAESALLFSDAGLVSIDPAENLAVVTGVPAHDGIKALKFQAVDSSSSYAERTVTGPSLVSFWWRVSSEKDYDLFNFSVDGVVQETISGEETWRNRALSLGEGTHKIRWTYLKDEADGNFEDAGYLDEVVIVDAFKDLQVTFAGLVLTGSHTLDFGTIFQDAPEVTQFLTLKNTGTISMPVTASLPADGGFVFSNGLWTNTQTLTAGQESILSLKLQSAVAGAKSTQLLLTATGSRTASPAVTLTGFIKDHILIVAGTGFVSGTFTTSGSTAGWDMADTTLPGGGVGQALKSGSTPDNGNSTIGCTLDGPGLLTWNWKASAQKGFDWLLCEVNGEEVAGISDKPTPWQSQVIQVPAGAEVRWIYRKDTGNQSGADTGYLTNIRFEKFTTPQITFTNWSATNGDVLPEALIPGTGMQTVFAWLGGFDPTAGPGPGQYLPNINEGQYNYRYTISKAASGQVHPQMSTDLLHWNRRIMSQTIIRENEKEAVVEIALPAFGDVFTRLTTEFPVFNRNMIKVQAGTLASSSWAGEQHVSAFLISKYEVQWGEWKAVRNWAISHGYDLGGLGAGRGESFPVSDVSWYDGVKWCNARSEMEGLIPVYKVGGAPFKTGRMVPDVNANADGYRLPSEKEWEFAARGGINTHNFVFSGSNDINTVAWYWDNTGYPTNTTHGVGTKAGNELGLYDMSGNVWEWCFDAYPDSGRIGRGGGWGFGFPSSCSVANRGVFSPDGEGYDVLGFRVARSIIP